jgi:hypothetical protein
MLLSLTQFVTHRTPIEMTKNDDENLVAATINDHS